MTDVETVYEDYVNIGGIQVNPLNFAPSDEKDFSKQKIPVSQLKHQPSPKKDDSNTNLNFYSK
jgi:hypothetical protein